jgi:hypothetical protein
MTTPSRSYSKRRTELVAGPSPMGRSIFRATQTCLRCGAKLEGIGDARMAHYMLTGQAITHGKTVHAKGN